jgi:DNA-binding PadR family transcriptional regulator
MIISVGIGTRYRCIMEPTSRPTITGPLQERILMILRYNPQCGKDLMNELRLKSPGTIYPVLDELRKKELIDYHLEISGSVRKKNYELTEKGRRFVRESLMSSAKMFCCDISLYADTVFNDAMEVLPVKKHQKVLCTLEYGELRRFLGGADITYTSEIETISDDFDVILSFPGVGCLLGRENADLKDQVGTLFKRLRAGGSMLVVEIERTENLFARIFFEDIRKLSGPPGITSEELGAILDSVGLRNVNIFKKSGLLYAVAHK